MVNGSTNASAGDTMQVFLGDVFLKDGTLHCFYSGNNAADIDKGFKATKTDDGSDTPFTKVLNAGLPKVILAPSAVNGTYDEDEVFVRSVFYDTDRGEWMMYFTANQIGASPAYTIGYATSSDGETFTKQGQIYTDGTTNIINIAVCKVSATDYRAIVTTSAAGGGATNNFSYDYLTSSDGDTWTKDSNMNSLFINTIIVWKILKQGDYFFIFVSSNNRDSDPSIGNACLMFKTTDFTSLIYVGNLINKNEPSERAIAGIAVIERTSTIEFYYFYYKNQNKTSSNGGEAYSAIRKAVLNSTTITQPVNVNSYPTWVKKYWPLNPESAIANAFKEIIDEDTASFTDPKWSLDGLNFFKFTGTGFTFTNNGSIFSTTDLSLKLRCEIVTSGTINLFSIGTDIVVQLVSGNLRVSLNNGTKDYITNADIAKPSGITDPGNHVYVGFTWQSGVLKLCVGNTIDIASTKTVDNAMTNIANSGSNVLLCSGATIEARSFVIMSGQTDQQWIDTDL
jgi:hypothetical protein